jgi:hypothetical protein
MYNKKPQDLTGKTFGRLKVLKCVGKNKYGHYQWLCRCDCGNTCIVKTGSLNRGTKSCGCLHREGLIKRNTKHGLAHTPIYNVWSAIKNRCLNQNDKEYKSYGGRGITLCNEWMTFKEFYNDMGKEYKPWLTIERRNVNGGYNKENCYWADMVTQANNTRRNRYETVDGVTDTVANLARKYGITYATAQHRLYRGWDIEKAFKTPQRNKKLEKE